MANFLHLTDSPSAVVTILVPADSWERKSAWVSTDPVTRSVAAELSARRFGPVTDFEREGECEDCEFVGDMEFVATGTETAEAECPGCGSTVEIYTAD